MTQGLGVMGLVYELGLGIRVLGGLGLGLRVQEVGLGVMGQVYELGLGFRVNGQGFSLGLRVQELGFGFRTQIFLKVITLPMFFLDQT